MSKIVKMKVLDVQKMAWPRERRADGLCLFPWCGQPDLDIFRLGEFEKRVKATQKTSVIRAK